MSAATKPCLIKNKAVDVKLRRAVKLMYDDIEVGQEIELVKRVRKAKVVGGSGDPSNGEQEQRMLRIKVKVEYKNQNYISIRADNKFMDTILFSDFLCGLYRIAPRAIVGGLKDGALKDGGAII